MSPRPKDHWEAASLALANVDDTFRLNFVRERNRLKLSQADAVARLKTHFGIAWTQSRLSDFETAQSKTRLSLLEYNALALIVESSVGVLIVPDRSTHYLKREHSEAWSEMIEGLRSTHVAAQRVVAARERFLAASQTLRDATGDVHVYEGFTRWWAAMETLDLPVFLSEMAAAEADETHTQELRARSPKQYERELLLRLRAAEAQLEALLD